MKTRNLLLFSILIILILTSVLAAAESAGLSGASTSTEADKKAADAYAKSPILRGVTFYIFGLKDLGTSNLANYGAATILIIFFLIWLILFVTFSDIIVSFGAFSNAAIGWIVGAALTTIAANLKIVQTVAIWVIQFTAIFGTLSVFFGILMAFIAFIAVSWGFGSLATWAQQRRANINAAHARRDVTHGLEMAAAAGRAGEEGLQQAWWIPLAIAGVIIIATILLIIFA